MQWTNKIDAFTPSPLRIALRGVGQVFFCGNTAAGFIFLVALYIGGFNHGLAATLGVCCSTLAAYLLGYSRSDIEIGLYGFNGTLVGPCLLLFLDHTPLLWLFVVLASILSSVVLAALIKILTPYGVPASTSPFVLTCWMFILAVYSLGNITRGPALPDPTIPIPLPATEAAGHAWFAIQSIDTISLWCSTLFKGLSEVMFADDIVVGALFLAGIAITSWRGAGMALCGALIGILVPIILGANQALIEMGLYAFNPILTVMALGWVFLQPSKTSTALAILAGIFTVLCQAALTNFLAPLGIPTLTFPFVLVMWMFLFAATITPEHTEKEA